MRAQRYDIFRGDNGRLLDQIFGYSNAGLSAQYHANRLGVSVGYGTEQTASYYKHPQVSKCFRPQNTREELESFIRSANRDFDAVTSWLSSPESDAAPEVVRESCKVMADDLLDNMADFRRELAELDISR